MIGVIIYLYMILLLQYTFMFTNGCVLCIVDNFQRMGTGRKAETYNVAAPKQDRSNTRWYGDQSFPARNLGEDALAGVIFGCTNKTMNECFSKQLFG